MTTALTVLIALVAGAVLGTLHMAVLHAAVTRSVARQSHGALLLTAPLRLALPALGLLSALFLGGGAALGGGLVGYVVTVHAARWRAVPRTEPEGTP